MPERDRDESGRPRSARPRDAFGRPLPRGVAAAPDIPDIPDDLRLTPPQTLAYAQELLDAGLAFYAHEVLESAWKTGTDDERMLWQGLAQLAVGICHLQRGNPMGAAALLARAGAKLDRQPRPGPHGIDVDGLLGAAAALTDELDSGQPITPNRLRPRLRRERPGE